MPTETPEEKKKRLEEERKERESRAKAGTPAPAAKSEPLALLKKPGPASGQPGFKTGIPQKGPDPALGPIKPGQEMPDTTSRYFDEAKYKELEQYSPAAARAYKESMQPSPKLEIKPELQGLPAAAGRILSMPQGQAPSEAARQWVNAPSITPSAPVIEAMTAASPDILEKTLNGAAEGLGQGKAITPQAAKAAEMTATAPPNRVEQVISKLKEEEAKGGPSLWDVIEAASAGWRGDVPIYVKKQLEEQAEKARMGQIETTAQLQAAIQAEEQAKMFERQRDLLREELASREKIAGLKGLEMDPLGSLTDEFLKGGF